MRDFLNLFDTREEALFLWLLVAILGVLFIKDVRQIVPGLADPSRAAISIPLALVLAYVAGVIAFLAWLGVWTRPLLGVPIAWVLGRGWRCSSARQTR